MRLLPLWKSTGSNSDAISERHARPTTPTTTPQKLLSSQVRMQKPKPDRCCECILDYLKSLQDGDPLSPDRSSLKKPNVAIPDDQSQIIAKCLAEVIGQQPSKDEVLGLLVKAFEKAVDN